MPVHPNFRNRNHGQELANGCVCGATNPKALTHASRLVGLSRTPIYWLILVTVTIMEISGCRVPRDESSHRLAPSPAILPFTSRYREATARGGYPTDGGGNLGALRTPGARVGANRDSSPPADGELKRDATKSQFVLEFNIYRNAFRGDKSRSKGTRVPADAGLELAGMTPVVHEGKRRQEKKGRRRESGREERGQENAISPRHESAISRRGDARFFVVTDRSVGRLAEVEMNHASWKRVRCRRIIIGTVVVTVTVTVTVVVIATVAGIRTRMARTYRNGVGRAERRYVAAGTRGGRDRERTSREILPGAAVKRERRRISEPGSNGRPARLLRP